MKFRKLHKKKKKKKNHQNSRNNKGNSFFCSFEIFLFYRSPRIKFLINSFLIQKTCILNIYRNNGIPPTLESSTSSSIKQYQLFLSTNSP